MASYEEFQAKVDDLTFKVEDLLRWAQGLTDVAQSGELGALAFVQSLAAAPVGNQATARGNLGMSAFGPTGSLPPNNALTGYVPAGFYTTNLQTAGAGGFADRNGNLLRLQRGEGGSNPGGVDVWANRVQIAWRGWSGGTPEPFSEIYHQRRIIGEVTQSGGIPTGAIIERGSNSNGQFIKFADGTLWNVRIVHPDYSVAVYQSFDFAMSCVDTPAASCSIATASPVNTVLDVFNGVSLLATSTRWRLSFRGQLGTTSDSAPVALFAVSRWFI